MTSGLNETLQERNSHIPRQQLENHNEMQPAADANEDRNILTSRTGGFQPASSGVASSRPGVRICLHGMTNLECPIESLAHIQDVTMTCWDADLGMVAGDGLLSAPREWRCPSGGPDGKNSEDVSSAAGVFVCDHGSP